MPVFLHPAFIADLQAHNVANFARRVLQKTIGPDGGFAADSDDHPYDGIEDAWIRYVSRGNTAYRVIFLRKGQNIYLFRAGEHRIEEHLSGPTAASLESALPVDDGGSEVAAAFAGIIAHAESVPSSSYVSRFKRHVRHAENVNHTQIYHEIFSRRNLPHKEIWLVAPLVDGELFAPTRPFGKLLLEQLEDGASVTLVTAPPKDSNIAWMEKLAEHGVGIFVMPQLHSKLYCFVFDEERRYMRGLHENGDYSSLILVGSSDLTATGLGVEGQTRNEELCYAVPDSEMGYVEDYVLELMTRGYELREVRNCKARGQWQRLESGIW